MRSYEIHVIESYADMSMARLVGLIDLHGPQVECTTCGQYLAFPYTVTLGEDDISVSRCGDCFPVLR